MDYLEWTRQEKAAYMERLEMVAAILEDEMELPATVKQPTTSGARGPVVIKSKPDKLPPAPFVRKKFADHLERAEEMLAKVDIEKKKSAKQENEDPGKTQVETKSKVKLGLALRPFDPKWLYKLTQNEPWPTAVLPDNAIKQLTDKEDPTEEYLITRPQIHKVQRVTSLQMNAASHIDWMLIAMNKLLAEMQDDQDKDDPRIKALQDLRYAVAYANEYIVDQAIFIHAGMTNHMREHYLDQMVGIEVEEHNDLITQPYTAISAFNGELSTLIKNKETRDRSAALHKMATNSAQDKSSSKPKKGDLMQKVHDLKQKNASRAKKKQNYGQFDAKGRKIKSKTNDGQWPKNQNTGSFPFNTSNFQKKKRKQGGYKPKSSSGRGRDHN